MGSPQDAWRGHIERLCDRDEVAIPCTLLVERQVGGPRRRRVERFRVPGMIVDVSPSGAGVVIPAASLLPAGSLRIRRLTTLLVGDLQARASVRYRTDEEHGVHLGLQFEAISTELQEQLHAAVAARKGTDPDLEIEMWNHAH